MVRLNTKSERFDHVPNNVNQPAPGIWPPVFSNAKRARIGGGWGVGGRRFLVPPHEEAPPPPNPPPPPKKKKTTKATLSMGQKQT